jgi:hypothetical protein
MDGLSLTSSVSASSMSPNLVLPYETADCPGIGKFFLLEPYLVRQASGFTKCGGEPKDITLDKVLASPVM